MAEGRQTEAARAPRRICERDPRIQLAQPDGADLDGAVLAAAHRVSRDGSRVGDGRPRPQLNRQAWPGRVELCSPATSRGWLPHSVAGLLTLLPLRRESRGANPAG